MPSLSQLGMILLMLILLPIALSVGIGVAIVVCSRMFLLTEKLLQGKKGTTR